MDSAQNRGAHLFGKTAKTRLPEKVPSVETQAMSSLDAQEMYSLGTQDASSFDTQEMSSLDAQEMSALEAHLWVTPVTQIHVCFTSTAE